MVNIVEVVKLWKQSRYFLCKLFCFSFVIWYTIVKYDVEVCPMTSFNGKHNHLYEE